MLPIIPSSDPFIGITAVSVAYGIFSYTVTHVLGNRKRLKRIRKEMNEYTKELRRAIKENDEKKLEELHKRQKEFNRLMMESFKYQMIPLVILLPTVGVVLKLIARRYSDFRFTLPFSIPYIHPSTEYGYLALFIIVVTLTSLFLSAVIGVYERFLSRRSEDRVRMKSPKS